MDNRIKELDQKIHEVLTDIHYHDLINYTKGISLNVALDEFLEAVQEKEKIYEEKNKQEHLLRDNIIKRIWPMRGHNGSK